MSINSITFVFSTFTRLLKQYFTLGIYLLTSLVNMLLIGSVTFSSTNVSADEMLRIQGNTDPIKIYLTVTSNDGKPIGGLSASEFQILEDDSSQVINSLSTPDTRPTSQVFVMDYSGSMREAAALTQMEQAVHNVLDLMGENDQAGVIKFNYLIGVEVMQELTSDKELLKSAVDKDPGGEKGTNLYDAISAAVKMLKDSNTTSDSSAIILLTDGQDSASSTPLSDLLTELDNANIPLFAIGLGSDIDANLLEELSQATGGEFASASNASDLDSVYNEIALRLKNEYLVTYYSAINDCEDHDLKVLVNTDEGPKNYQTTFARCFPEITIDPVSNNSSKKKKKKFCGTTGYLEILILSILMLGWRFNKIFYKRQSC